MRKSIVSLAMFAFAGSLWAADPIIGTWKLNIAKSKLDPIRANTKEETLAFRALGDHHYKLIYHDVRADGSTSSSKCTWPKQGGVRRYQEGGLPEGILIVETFLAANEGLSTVLQNGKQITVNHWVFDDDNKTMRIIGKGVDANGKAYNALLLFERQ
jgi:hypothetical protein